jgi:hypothetical protein
MRNNQSLGSAVSFASNIHVHDARPGEGSESPATLKAFTFQGTVNRIDRVEKMATQ